MQAEQKWLSLGWRHPLWELHRFYLSIRGSVKQKAWIDNLREHSSLSVSDAPSLPIPTSVVDLFFEYLEHRENLYDKAYSLLRTEEEALDYCKNQGIPVGVTATRNADHHQSSKAMIAAVNNIAKRACKSHGLTFDSDPQNRAVWMKNSKLHVSARNLDGAVPGLANPFLVWEIKEYWGKTGGGSKMSDAVYECHLVGLELKEFEESANEKITHVVFVDGKTQWESRKSDLRRFLDLMNQGLIDHLVIGKEVENQWQNIMDEEIKRRN